MPHNKIATRKGHQGWMKEEGPYFIFPGGGTMFPDRALPYIDKLRRFMPIKSGIIRTALDMGYEWPKKEKEWEEIQAVVRALCYELIIAEGNMADTRRWATRVAYYKNTLKVKVGTPAICNVMDMNAFFGGFAATLETDPVWVIIIVLARKPLTLNIIYDRGLIEVYHDWCEPFSTYPRTYDLIYVASIDSLTKLPGSRNSSCSLVDLMAEIEGTAVIQDLPENIDLTELRKRIRRKIFRTTPMKVLSIRYRFCASIDPITYDSFDIKGARSLEVMVQTHLASRTPYIELYVQFASPNDTFAAAV
ncbi:hypothetical protein PVK06_027992 [Gossypium arboreum]|uniref:Methyltransferase n=1 Tax=Gossypium arboreum TaxID=29729 RepID=A0ABR0P279_GOSAR|nr:hypothetical protein PVK06_027992 [Gossypium arboreum]